VVTNVGQREDKHRPVDEHKTILFLQVLRRCVAKGTVLTRYSKGGILPLQRTQRVS